MYNQLGHAGVDPNFQGENPFQGFEGFQGFNFGDGSFHFSSSAQEIDPEDLFDAFFGGSNRRRRKPRGPRRGSDLQMHIRLSFTEAVFGASKDLHLRYQVQDEKGNTNVKERDVVVETPPGIENGMNLRLAGQGAEGDPGAPRGNLLVQVVVEDDDYFVRDGADVHTEVPISFTQAILGGTVEVKTLNGTVEMKVPKGSQVDTKLMLRGKGIQRLHGGGKGNHIVHLKIEIPKEVTHRQEQLLREYDEEAQNHGTGISGRLAKAAGSAFETLFGGKHKKDENAEGDKQQKARPDDGTDDDSYNKKAAV
jgi:molecular chaperone DnaJ